MFSPIWGKRNGRGISGFAVNRGAVNRGFTVVLFEKIKYFVHNGHTINTGKLINSNLPISYCNIHYTMIVMYYNRVEIINYLNTIMLNWENNVAGKKVAG